MIINEIPKGAQPPMLKFDNDTQFHQQLAEYEHEIHIRTFKAIKYALDTGFDEDITIAFLNDEDTILGIPPEVWHDNLELSMQYFIGIEDYKICSQIKDLLGKLG